MCVGDVRLEVMVGRKVVAKRGREERRSLGEVRYLEGLFWMPVLKMEENPITLEDHRKRKEICLGLIV